MHSWPDPFFDVILFFGLHTRAIYIFLYFFLDAAWEGSNQLLLILDRCGTIFIRAGEPFRREGEN